MSENFLGDVFPAAMDAQLQQLLSAWRSQHQLDESRVESIRAAILASPASHHTTDPTAISDVWWDRYTQYLNRILDETLHTAQRAAQRAAKRNAQLRRGIASINKPQPWMLTPNYGIPTSPDWQPYLKLM
jgi:hypothetical protein